MGHETHLENVELWQWIAEADAHTVSARYEDILAIDGRYTWAVAERLISMWDTGWEQAKAEAVLRLIAMLVGYSGEVDSHEWERGARIMDFLLAQEGGLVMACEAVKTGDCIVAGAVAGMKTPPEALVECCLGRDAGEPWDWTAFFGAVTALRGDVIRGLLLSAEIERGAWRGGICESFAGLLELLTREQIDQIDNMGFATLMARCDSEARRVLFRRWRPVEVRGQVLSARGGRAG